MGFDKNPLYKDRKCFGNNLRNINPPKGLSLQYIISYYKEYKKMVRETHSSLVQNGLTH